MWKRADLKQKAKSVLRNNYWQAFLIALIVGLLSGSDGAAGVFMPRRLLSGNDTYEMYIMVARTVSIVYIILWLLRVVIGYTFQVGGTKFFIRAAKGESNTSNLVYGFQNNHYIKIVLTMLLREVYIFLWTLLLIIPGIIKGYSYRLVPYILADNPEIGYNRAIELSNQMTKGEKWQIFVLDLSFIGWYLLGMIVCGVGVLFVHPYQRATNAELYLILRDKALNNNFTTKSELNLQ